MSEPTTPLGDQRRKLEEKILSDYPRLGPDDRFRFSCHPGRACFNHCCSDVNIFLSPYDVLRLRRRLGMGSKEFLEQHTMLPIQADMRTPVVMLRMGDDEARNCHFLTEAGCSVYQDRPWPCRMYPLGMASQKDTPDGWQGDRFYFLMQEGGCLGYENAREWTVRDWIEDQGVGEYDAWGEAFKELALNDFFEKGGELTPEKMEMFYMACYDLDKFRRFVFDTTLLEKFDVDEDFVEEMRYSDEALLRFGFLWVRFSLFGEKTMKIRGDAAEAARQMLEKRTIPSRKPARSAQGETR